VNTGGAGQRDGWPPGDGHPPGVFHALGDGKPPGDGKPLGVVRPSGNGQLPGSVCLQRDTGPPSYREAGPGAARLTHPAAHAAHRRTLFTSRLSGPEVKK
jgi:hypothetical protein